MELNGVVTKSGLMDWNNLMRIIIKSVTFRTLLSVMLVNKKMKELALAEIIRRQEMPLTDDWDFYGVRCEGTSFRSLHFINDIEFIIEKYRNDEDTLTMSAKSLLRAKLICVRKYIGYEPLSKHDSFGVRDGFEVREHDIVCNRWTPNGKTMRREPCAHCKKQRRKNINKETAIIDSIIEKYKLKYCAKNE